MGRPLRLVYTPPTWATVNFPSTADPWSLQPSRLSPIITFFTPNVPPAAEDHNWLIGSAFDGLSTLKTFALATFDQVSAIGAQNWPYSGALSGVTNCYPIWDSFNARWLYANGTNSSTQLNQSVDGGATWSTLGATFSIGSSLIYGLVQNTVNGNVLAMTNGGSACVWNGATWSVTSPLGVLVQWTECLFFNSLYVVIGGGSSLANVQTSPDGVTFTSRTAQVPAGASAVVTWCASTSGSILVAMPRNVAGNGNFMTTTDGATWTARTLGAVLGGSDLVQAISWSPADLVFLACVQSGTGTRVLTSADGITWSLKTTIANRLATGIAANGALWALVTADTPNRALYSADAGATWTVAAFAFGGAGGGIRQVVVPGTGQFFACNGSYGRGSLITS